MGTEQKKRRNHWVPQSYLRAFAADPRREKIWAFGKERFDPALMAIRNVAVKSHLYVSDGPEGRDYSFEDSLSQLEQLFGSPVWHALGSEAVDLNWPSLRKGVSLLAAVMYLRNPLRLKQARQLHRHLVDTISALPALPDSFIAGGIQYELDHGDWPAYRDAGDDEIKRMWLGYVGSAASLAEIFMQMRWIVLVSETPSFITTDNPVVALDESLTFKGFRNKDVSVVFPLSPTRVLHMDWRHEEPDGQYYAVNPDTVPLNLLLWRNSIDMMFAPRHPDEVCAEFVRFADAQEAA